MTPVPYAIADDQTVEEAHARMTELDVRHLPVMRGSRLVGIVSQRDLAALTASTRAHPSTLRVSDAMSSNPYTASPDTPLSEVARRMADERYGAVLIVDDGTIQGIFTTTDALRILSQLLT